MSIDSSEQRGHEARSPRSGGSELLPPFKSRLLRAGGIALLALFLGGCAGAPSTLAPEGPAAEEIAYLWWFMFVVGGGVFVVVMALLFYALFRSRRAEPEGERQAIDGTRLVVIGGIVIPAIILLVLFGFTLNTLAAVSSSPTAGNLRVSVVGSMWWWEVRYPEAQVTTANEIHIPVGQPVELSLTSEDVIHSFWLPQLHGKMDLIPGKLNTFWIQADEPGIYYGECAEYCGTQHAKMAFLVVAEPPDQFADWLERQSRPAEVPVEPLAEQGLEVFLRSDCVVCHTIRGTDATGDLGPDLTHVASRLTLGAGSVANTLGNLGGWVADPHAIKPGVKMPPADLRGEELGALLAYLESLK